jgi:hypothetical protein
VSPQSADRFERTWALSEDGRRLSRWRDPDAELARKRRSGELARFTAAEGLSLEDAEWQLRGHLERARQRFAKRRSGRKPSNGPPEHYSRWQDLYEQLEPELLDAYEADKKREGEKFAGKRPGHMGVCAAVAEHDWREHLLVWPRDRWWASPNDADALHPDMRRDAATRVLNGLKALQNALIQKTAA